MKALLFFVAIVLVFLFVRFTFKRLQQIRQNSSEATDTPHEEPATAKMVSCEVCGVHLPQETSLSVTRDGVTHYACCHEHLAQLNAQF